MWGGKYHPTLRLRRERLKDMRECRWYYADSNECWIDCPDSMYPCIAKGDLDKCPHIDLNGKPLKDSEYCKIKE